MATGLLLRLRQFVYRRRRGARLVIARLDRSDGHGVVIASPRFTCPVGTDDALMPPESALVLVKPTNHHVGGVVSVFAASHAVQNVACAIGKQAR